MTFAFIQASVLREQGERTFELDIRRSLYFTSTEPQPPAKPYIQCLYISIICSKQILFQSRFWHSNQHERTVGRYRSKRPYVDTHSIKRVPTEDNNATVLTAYQSWKAMEDRASWHADKFKQAFNEWIWSCTVCIEDGSKS